MISSRERSFEVCESHVKDWAPSYAHHTQLVREVVGISTFRTIWSKPTKENPISDILAEVEVIVDLTGDEPVVQHRLDSGFTTFARQLRFQELQIDRHIADKRAVRDVLLSLNEAERLPKPQPFVPGAKGLPLQPSPVVEAASAASAASAQSDPAVVVVDDLLFETNEQLEEVLVKLFRDADADRNGVLDVGEFFQLFRTADLDLEPSDVAFLLAEADVSGDGVVQYSEFVPVAVDVIQSLRLRTRHADVRSKAYARATDEAVTTLYGLGRGELEGVMKDVFLKADENGDGLLSRAEFAGCLQRVRLGPTRLSKREMNYFQAVVSADSEGRVSYESFVPVLWDLLVETLKSSYLAASQGDLFSYLRDLCVAADAPALDADGVAHHSGQLSRAELQRVLLGAERVRMSLVQVFVVLAEAEETEGAAIDYGAFLLLAVPLVESLCSPLLEKRRRSAAQRAQLSPTAAVLAASDQEAVRARLQLLLGRLAQGGLLPHAELERCLRSPELGLSQPQLSALLALSQRQQELEEGPVDIARFVSEGCELLLTLTTERALLQAMRDEEASDLAGDAAVELH